jgi:hypothetical protein
MTGIAFEVVHGPGRAVVALHAIDINTIRRAAGTSVNERPGEVPVRYVQVVDGKIVATFRDDEIVIVPVGDIP